MDLTNPRHGNVVDISITMEISKNVVHISMSSRGNTNAPNQNYERSQTHQGILEIELR